MLPWRHRATFRNLNATNHTVTSLESSDYNCAAWAARDDQVRWWPDSRLAEYYWPTPRRDGSLDAVVEGFESLGFVLCPSPELETGYEKLAIFANDDGPTHVARQLNTGRWTSKLGDWEDIEHSTLANVECDGYGRAVRFMRRPLPQQE